MSNNSISNRYIGEGNTGAVNQEPFRCDKNLINEKLKLINVHLLANKKDSDARYYY